MKRDFRPKDWFLAGLVFIFFFFFYGRLAADGLVGGDAGDFGVNIFQGGMAHPPGYPLYIVISRLFIRLFPQLTVAKSISLVSSFFGAAGLAVFYLVSSQIYKKRWVGLVTTSMLGFSYLYWLLSVVQEIFTLNLFLIMVAFLAAVLWQKKTDWRLLALFFLVSGLEAAHHHTFIFLLPAFGWLFYQKLGSVKKLKPFLTAKRLTFYAALFLAGFSFYLYIFAATKIDSPTNWFNELSLDSFWGLLSRRIYGTFSSTNTFDFSLRQGILAVFALLQFTLTELGLVNLGLLLLGTYRLIKRKEEQVWFAFFGIWFLLIGIGFNFYAAFPLSSWFLLGTAERFYLLIYPPLFGLVGFGLLFLTDLIKKEVAKREKQLNQPQILVGALLAVFIIFPLASFRKNLEANDFRGFQEIENFGRYFLSPCPEGSVVFAHGDLAYFTSTYARYVLDFRPDLEVLNMAGSSTFFSYLKNQVDGFETLSGEGDLLEEVFVTAGGLGRPICTNRLFNFESVGFQTGYRIGSVSIYLPADQPLPTREEFLELNASFWAPINLPSIQAEVEKRDYFFGYDILEAYQRDLLAVAEHTFMMEAYEDSRFFLDKASQIGLDEDKLTRLNVLQLIKASECRPAKLIIEEYDLEFGEVENWSQIKEVYSQECSDPIDMAELEEYP